MRLWAEISRPGGDSILPYGIGRLHRPRTGPDEPLRVESPSAGQSDSALTFGAHVFH